MSRYIDADALHKAYMELRNFKQDPQSGDWISLRAVPLTTVIRMLNEAPSIDIVRCKDCKWCLVEEGGCERIGMVLFADEIENHFCGYGERKESE